MFRLVFIIICLICNVKNFCEEKYDGLWSDFQSNPLMGLHSSVIHFKTEEGKQITYIAVYHSNDLTGPVIKTIENIIESERPEICILEGFEASEGLNPQRIIDMADQYLESGKCGENLYAAKLCQQKGIDFIGGEVGEYTYLKPLQTLGFSQKDLVFYLLAQQIPYWHLQNSFQERTPKDLFENFLKEAISNWIRVPVNYTYEEFLSWHKENIGKDYDLNQDFLWRKDSLELIPNLGDKATIYQRIAAHVMLMRDQHIVEMIKKISSVHSKVLIIYGACHYEWQSKVLQKEFGQPMDRLIID